jgi:broad specificity phosphatase PhoE
MKHTPIHREGINDPLGTIASIIGNDCFNHWERLKQSLGAIERRPTISTLILIRHSQPEIDPTLPASQWRLSETGRLRCRPLADRLTVHHPDVIVASAEPKAVETAQIVAALLDKPFETAEGLHEHDRHDVGPLSKAQFEAAVADLFANPQRLVFGRETADQAHRRFAKAIAGVLARHPGNNVAVVTHGTVMTLFVARTTGLEPLPFWKELGLPAFVVLSRPQFGLVTVIKDVEDTP